MFSGEQVFFCVANINIIYKLINFLVDYSKFWTNRCDLLKKQWAPHNGSWAAPACHCSVHLFILWECHNSKKTQKYKYATKVKMPDIIQPIIIFPQFGWVRRNCCVCNGWNCLYSNGFALKGTNKNQQTRIESSSVYENWRI